MKGWLVNKQRRRRRDEPNTLIASQVLELIEEIDKIEKYSKLQEENDLLLRKRDKALIALAWIWFKRGNEDLAVKVNDVYYNERELLVTFRIEKKKRRIKVCSECEDINALKAKYCKKCGLDISEVEPIEKGEKEVVLVTKRKNVDYPFCKFVIEWIEVLKAIDNEAFMFPPYNYQAKTFLLNKHITVQRFDQILQRLDPTMSSCMFRYGHTEVLFTKGYTNTEIKEIGDWSSEHMPEIYAKRKGFTASQKRFAEDIRIE